MRTPCRPERRWHQRPTLAAVPPGCRRTRPARTAVRERRWPPGQPHPGRRTPARHRGWCAVDRGAGRCGRRRTGLRRRTRRGEVPGRQRAQRRGPPRLRSRRSADSAAAPGRRRRREAGQRRTDVPAGVTLLQPAGTHGLQRGAVDDAELPGAGHGPGQGPAGDGNTHAPLDDLQSGECGCVWHDGPFDKVTTYASVTYVRVTTSEIRDVSPAGAPRRGRPPSAIQFVGPAAGDTVLYTLARSTRAGPSLGAASGSPTGPTPRVPLTYPHLHPMHTSCIGTELVCIY